MSGQVCQSYSVARPTPTSAVWLTVWEFLSFLEGVVCCKSNGIERGKICGSEKVDVVKTYPLVKVIRMCIMGACICGRFIERRTGNGTRIGR